MVVLFLLAIEACHIVGSEVTAILGHHLSEVQLEHPSTAIWAKEVFSSLLRGEVAEVFASASAYWVREGSLAGNFRVGFPGIFGQTWAQDPSRSPGLALQFNLHEKSAPQTNSKAIS